MKTKQKEAKIVARIKITDLEGLSLKGRKELVEWLKKQSWILPKRLTARLR